MNKINILFTFCLICLACVQISAQQLSFQLSPSTITGAIGDEIDVEVQAGSGFTDIIGVQFGLNYNGAALEFISTDSGSNPLNPFFSLVKIPNRSEILNNYVDIFGLTPATLAPGTVLYTIKFKILSDIGNSIDILCGGDNVACEFSDISAVKSNDIVLEQVAAINGGGDAENTGPINIIIGNETTSTASQTCVEFAVSDFVDILSMQFSIQYDESLLSFAGLLQNAGNCPGGPPSTVSNPLCITQGDHFNVPEPGTITFSFSDLFGGNSFTLPDGTVIFDLCFDALGAGGTSSDIIINGDPTFIQVIKAGEGSENFGVVSNVGTIDISGTGGALDAVSYSIGSASGDAGTNVCIPVTVDDGFDDITGFGWSIDYDPSILSYTGTQNVNSALTNVGGIETNTGTVNYLWVRDFSPNSEVTLADGSVLYEMCFDVIGASGQVSALEFSDDPTPIETVKVDGSDPDTLEDQTLISTTNGNITVTNSEGFNLIFCEADACPGDQVCVPLVATGFVEISALTFTVNFDPAVLDFTGLMNNQPTFGANEPAATPGLINALYINTGLPPNPTSLSLEDCEVFAEFCFDVIGAQGASSALSVTSDNLEFAAADDAGEQIEVASTSGAVNVDCSGTAGTPTIECVCGNTATELTINENATEVEDVTCNGDQDGSITLSVAGGEMPLTYSWSNGANTKDLTDVGPGNYTIDVSDNAGVMVSATFTVVEPTVISPSSTASNTSASGADDGSIMLSVTGGTAPYTYMWSSGQMTADITGLAPDTYNVTITDANDCTVVTSRAIGDQLVVGPSGGPGSPAGTTIITDATCFGENIGSIELAITGGVAPLSISWNTGSDQASLLGLAAGNYCVTITDTNGDQVQECYDVSGPANAITVAEMQTPQSIPGANDGALALTVTGGTSPYTYNWNGPGVSDVTTKDIAGLTEGNYEVNVTDANGCVVSRTFFLETAGETLTVNSGATQVANVSCFGEADGAINALVTGGATPYTYSWGGPGNFAGNTANISGLEPGAYQLTVTDAVGAIAESVVFSIAAPSAALTATANIIEESSIGQNDGGVELTVTGGTPGYSFSWNNNRFTEDIFALTSGTYTVTITDSRGCTFVESYSVGTEADPLVINAQGSTVNSVRCFGDSNGSISPVVNGGFPPYNYNWGPQGTTETISGLAAGMYTLTVTDQNGLSNIQTFNVQSPTQIQIAVAVIPESSNGNDGSIQVTVTGGTPNYSYGWSGPNGFFSSAEDLTGLTEGVFMLNVTDANGCQEQAVVNLGAVLSIENKFETDVPCSGECSGEIDIVVTGGQPPYLYNWAGPTGFSASTQDIDDLCAGVYTATITDAAGQQVFSTCRIDEPFLALSIAANPTIIDEAVPSLGSINITVNGGTAPYTYQWSNNATSEDLTGLLAGSYRVTVTDANGCIAISPEYQVDRVALSLTIENLVINNPTCNGDCNGSVMLQIVGGDAPYTVTWNDQGAQTLSSVNPSLLREDMCAGDYVLTVTDANGQEQVLDIELEDLPAIEVDGVVTAEINGMDGTINTTVTGGQAPYIYEWSPSTLPSTADQENLTAGLFIVTVTDANDCTEIESFVIANEIQPIVIAPGEVITQIDCFGDMNGSIDITVSGGVQPYNFLWSDGQVTEDAIGLGAGSDYAVTVTDANGDQAFGGEYEIVTPAEIVPMVIKISDPTMLMPCDGSYRIDIVSGGQAPYSYLWSSGEMSALAEEICPGLQGVTVTDALGCTGVIEITVVDPSLINLSVDVQQENVDCNGDASGTLSATAFGGFAPYNYLWSTGDETQNIGNLLAGIYSLTVTDEAGTIIEDGLVYEITEPDAIAINFNITEETGPGTGDGAAEAIVTGGCAPYTYQWNDPSGCNTFECEDLLASTYFVVVQDAKECIRVDSVAVGSQFGGECQMTRNIITPGGNNNDDKNNTFLIQCAPGSINTLEIYNRWGQLVFLAENYDNTWEGTDRRGQELPAGGYFYVFIFEDPLTGESQPFQGHITILRD